MIETLSHWPMLLASGEDRFPGLDEADATVPPGSVVKITGPLVERGICDGWPIEVVSLGVPLDPRPTGARVGDTGVIGEQAFQVPAFPPSG